MVGETHGLFVSVYCFALPRCDFTFSLFCDYKSMFTQDGRGMLDCGNQVPQVGRYFVAEGPDSPLAVLPVPCCAIDPKAAERVMAGNDQYLTGLGIIMIELISHDVVTSGQNLPASHIALSRPKHFKLRLSSTSNPRVVSIS